jgi:outer membrane protein assembly factor BamB
VAPAVVGETVYVPNKSAVSALDTSDGTERWRFDTTTAGGASDMSMYGPAVANATVAVTGEGGQVYLLE